MPSCARFINRRCFLVSGRSTDCKYASAPLKSKTQLGETISVWREPPVRFEIRRENDTIPTCHPERASSTSESKGPHRVGGALILSENRPCLGGRKPSSPYSFVALTRNILDGRVAHSLPSGDSSTRSRTRSLRMTGNGYFCLSMSRRRPAAWRCSG